MSNNPELTFFYGLMMVLALAACGASLFLLRRGITLNPIAYFIGVFIVQILGTYPQFSPLEEADEMHAYLILIASLVILFFSFLFGRSQEMAVRIAVWKKQPDLPLMQRKLAGKRRKRSAWRLMRHELSGVVFLFGVSIAASLLYYRIVGYNLFVEAMTTSGGEFEIGVDDFTTRRLASYAGDSYTGAGIFNQFKNTVLPISFFAILMHLLARAPWGWAVAFLAFTGPIFLYCILGTGQRAFLFYSLMMFVIATVNQKKKNLIVLAGFVVGFLVLFGTYSVVLGRQAEGEQGLVGALGQLYYRIFMAQQKASVMGFRYLYPLEITYGYEWFQSFRGLIPGVRGSDLSNRVHAYMYISHRGTAPVSFWVSAYHNFGVVGVVSAGVIWLMILKKTFLFLLGLKKSAINRMVMSALLLYCGLTVVATPAQIFNYGLLGIIFIFLIVGISRQRMPMRGGSSDRIGLRRNMRKAKGI